MYFNVLVLVFAYKYRKVFQCILALNKVEDGECLDSKATPTVKKHTHFHFISLFVDQCQEIVEVKQASIYLVVLDLPHT